MNSSVITMKGIANSVVLDFLRNISFIFISESVKLMVSSNDPELVHGKALRNCRRKTSLNYIKY